MTDAQVIASLLLGAFFMLIACFVVLAGYAVVRHAIRELRYMRLRQRQHRKLDRLFDKGKPR